MVEEQYVEKDGKLYQIKYTGTFPPDFVLVEVPEHSRDDW